MSSSDPDPNTTVPLQALADMAVAVWRLQNWLGTCERTAALPAHHAAKQMHRLLAELGLEIVDLTGSRYEPGLAVEVVDTIRDAELSRSGTVIAETITPLILWKNTVIREGQVVTRRSPETVE